MGSNEVEGEEPEQVHAVLWRELSAGMTWLIFALEEADRRAQVVTSSGSRPLKMTTPGMVEAVNRLG